MNETNHSNHSNLKNDPTGLCGVDMTEDLRLYRTADSRYKGLIFDQQNEWVMQNFPIPTESVLPRDTDGVRATLATDTFPLTVYEAQEGTILRAYCFRGEWRLSTTSRIDAFGSHWAAEQSFGDQFKEFVWKIAGIPLEVFFCSLRADRKYFFLLPTTGINRLGRLPEDDRAPAVIYLVAIETEDRVLHYGHTLPRDESNLWSFVREWTVASIDDLVTLGAAHNLLYYRSASEIFKFQTEAYADRCALRNNEANLCYRFLELYTQHDRKRCDALAAQYPEADFDALVVEPLDRLVYVLHQAYLTRYVQRPDVVEHLPRLLFSVLRQCHAQYLETREKTTRKRVKHVVLNQHPKDLLKLIRTIN